MTELEFYKERIKALLEECKNVAELEKIYFKLLAQQGSPTEG